MYKELVRRNVIILSVSLLLIFVLSLAAITYVNNNNTKKQLVYFGEVISAQLVEQTDTDADFVKFVERMTEGQKWLAVTVAGDSGNILADSTQSLEGTVKYLSDEERTRAASSNQDDHVYQKDGKMWYILTVSDSSTYSMILRLSLESADLTEYILVSVFTLTVALVFVVLGSTHFTAKTSRNVVEAFDKVSTHLKSISEGTYTDIETTHPYEEVSAAYREINAVNESIVDYITEIKDQRDKIDYIINNVAEGLVIVADSGKIYAVNDYARRVMNVGEFDEHTPYYKAIGNSRFVELIARQIAEKQHLEVDVCDETSDKIYHVMLSSFQNGSLGEHLVSAVLFDVTDVRREEKSKAEFIANASHELKTPITAISGFSELLLSGMVKDGDAVNNYLDNIHEASISMRRTIDDLLYLSRLDYSDSLTNAVDVNLFKLAEDEAEKYRFLAQDKDVSVDVVGTNAVICGDVSLLTHLVDNLIDNAIKYNKQGGKVTVGVQSENGATVLFVSDTGCGIDQKNIDNLFKRFYRVDSSRNRSTGGTGLGLTIAQKICTLHGAKMEVTSTVGVGTTFKVIFKK